MFRLFHNWLALHYRPWLGILVMGVCAGCQPDQKIETITIPLEKSGLPIRAASATRMVVAIARRPEATWFFKVAGPVKATNETEDAWTDFLKKIKFNSDNEPIWELPAGWSIGGKRPERFATLKIDNKDRANLEIAISRLGPDFDVLSNFNRWRGQLGLPAINESGLDEEIGELNFEGGTYLIFDRTGESNGSMTPPFAGGGNSKGAQINEPSNVQPAEIPTIKYEIPPGWEVQANAPVVAVRLEKKQDGNMAQISVTPLPLDVAPWDESIQTWLTEIGSTNQPSRESLEKLTQQVDVVDVKAQRIDLIGLEGATKGIIGVRLEAHGRAWFVKLAGPNEMVKASVPDFDYFLTSLKF